MKLLTVHIAGVIFMAMFFGFIGTFFNAPIIGGLIGLGVALSGISSKK
jgi:hypothetical protein